MNVGGGEAADQIVRMMLSGGEIVIKLCGSTLKNVLALSMALAKNHKTLSGKIKLGRMLKQTRDLRSFPMTRVQYRRFQKLALKQKILFSAVHNADGRHKLIDVIMPVTEVDRANQIFERVMSIPEKKRRKRRRERKEQPEPEQSTPEHAEPERQTPTQVELEQPTPEHAEPERQTPKQPERRADSPKKDTRLRQGSRGTKASSATPKIKGTTAAKNRPGQKPSVEGRLNAYRIQLQQQKRSAPARTKAKTRHKPKARAR